MSKGPLSGRQFLVTRSRDQAAAFVSLIEERGGTAICVPTIEIVPPEDYAPLDREIRDLDDVDILILTSANGVSAFFERLFANEQYVGLLNQVQVVSVGPKTDQALAEYAITADLVPANHCAEGIVEELLRQNLAGKKILYPRAALARPYLAEELRRAGAEVADPVAYRTLAPLENAEEIRRLLKSCRLDAICFTSSSTFTNLTAMLGEDLRSLLGTTELFSIGPLTSETIRKRGYRVDLEPAAWTLESLVEAMVGHYRLKK